MNNCNNEPVSNTFNNFSDEFSRFSRFTPYTEPWLVPHGFSVLVDADEGDRVDGGEQDGSEPDTARLTVDVQHVGVSLRCSIELTDELDSESESIKNILV